MVLQRISQNICRQLYQLALINSGFYVMGQHIVPRHLLLKISPDGKTVWQYDKKDTKVGPKRLPVSKVSQTPEYFDPDIEKLLSTIEGAANPILDRLAHGEAITAVERRKISIYLEMFGVRDRESRRQHKEKFFGSHEKVENYVDAVVESEFGVDAHLISETQKSDAVERLISCPDAVFSGMWEPSNFIRFFLYVMTWRVLKSDTVNFVIGEPPFAVGGNVGLKHPNMEAFFPLSCRHVLHLSWLGDPSRIELRSIPPSTARQINKIFIAKADRLVFFNENCPKMNEVVKKRHLHFDTGTLNWRIRGENPFRPTRDQPFTDSEIRLISANICMHPNASRFRHVWVDAKKLKVVNGGTVVASCKHCHTMQVKYDNKPEPVRINSEVALATRQMEPLKNWWMVH